MTALIPENCWNNIRPANNRKHHVHTNFFLLTIQPNRRRIKASCSDQITCVQLKSPMQTARGFKSARVRQVDLSSAASSQDDVMAMYSSCTATDLPRNLSRAARDSAFLPLHIRYLRYGKCVRHDPPRLKNFIYNFSS